MADQALAETEKPPASAAPPSRGVPMKVVLLMSLLMLLVGGGGAFAILKWRGSETPAATEHTQATAAQGGADPTAQPVFFDLDSFIVNLADVGETRYLKLTMKLELKRPDVATELTARIPQVRDAVLLLLSNKESRSLLSTQGKFELREELIQRLNTMLPHPGVRTVYFTEFVVQ
jgi:flagellar FliL protein